MLNEMNTADFLATVNHGMVTCVPAAGVLAAAMCYGDAYAASAGEPTYCTSSRSKAFTHMLYACANPREYLVIVIENSSNSAMGHFLMTCEALLAPGRIPGAPSGPA